MAKKETFLLVSLEEEKAKKLAQVISNDTCRKILDRLAANKATETELSRELSIPISTVHYNLKHLVENKLVEAEEFHYSEKGKEVLHYSLSNKYVIIAPKGVSDKFRDKLKSIIGAIVSVGFIGLAVQYVPKLFFGSVGAVRSAKLAVAPEMESSVAEIMVDTAIEETTAVSGASMDALVQEAPTIAEKVVKPAYTVVESSPNILMWVVIGAVLCMILYLFFEYIRNKYGKK